MKVHSGALKPEDQLTQHLPAQTGSALISTAPAGTAGTHGCREPGAATGKSPCHAVLCHAGGRSEGRTRGEQGWRGERTQKGRASDAAFPTRRALGMAFVTSQVQNSPKPPAAGHAAGRLPFPWPRGGFGLPVSCPFRRKFSGFSFTATGTCIIDKEPDWYISVRYAVLRELTP